MYFILIRQTQEEKVYTKTARELTVWTPLKFNGTLT